jgi:hypothetical protein
MSLPPTESLRVESPINKMSDTERKFTAFLSPSNCKRVKSSMPSPLSPLHSTKSKPDEQKNAARHNPSTDSTNNKRVTTPRGSTVGVDIGDAMTTKGLGLHASCSINGMDDIQLLNDTMVTIRHEANRQHHYRWLAAYRTMMSNDRPCRDEPTTLTPSTTELTRVTNPMLSIHHLVMEM